MASRTDEDDIVNATSALDINTNGGAPQAHQSTEASRNLDGTTERQSQARTKARDITVEFFGASNALRTGQLIKDEYFTMFESVGAIEVMDPKMDSGYVEPGDTLEDDYDVLRDLSCKEFLGIMDQLLCHEVCAHWLVASTRHI
ncbi:N-alpha-acetyltransferase, non-catalitic subunit [Cryomyces antarcticus]|uniref:N-alpha-acetyltransferase, non-catalitic subunit n=1 Tax=Cryomyces antarcticus TaxID=329879 RepID=A0ABR0M6D2_9PEZI|nr:N-alpha-acetyltransferase, non-catalitic subunit [Cryomyces antarcticus]